MTTLDADTQTDNATEEEATEFRRAIEALQDRLDQAEKKTGELVAENGRLRRQLERQTERLRENQAQFRNCEQIQTEIEKFRDFVFGKALELNCRCQQAVGSTDALEKKLSAFGNAQKKPGQTAAET